ncbi:putative disease resistance protein RGA1 [Beta vulgaris subsp. vulgaris]|uniref:putative disease resistance protein RGA1 n=1 Tax=Beta vulgaris subsp. vulgaris TaxID=3555 RepID=UPI002548B49D|nr:putative disease resistance protein RGA1 [Beta vulgaris subsp. vulgaris]
MERVVYRWNTAETAGHLWPTNPKLILIPYSALQSFELKEILSIFGYKSQLDDLQRTVSTINAVFRDAETKQELTHEAQHWLEELKDAVFEADDLFDEFVTLAEQKQLVEAGGSLSKKMRQFFSDSNPLGIAYRMSRGVKKIKKKLDAIAYNHQFSFKIDLEPIKERRLETGSVVNAGDIIGREDDLEKIVGLLLDSNIQRDVSFLTIVGMGGLDQKQLDVKEILGKILSTATGKNHEGSTMDQVQTQLREQLCGKRYLLVLDDVWNENPNQLRDLVEFFMGGQRGNWIVVTTRSHETTRIIRDGPLHKLQVDKCARNPLAIRVVGSLLCGQDKSKWLSFHEICLANIRKSHNDIMPILNLSYHHLEPPIRRCFSYCAVFPKDFLIGKKTLINLWMAQGYIVPLDKDQSIDDASEEYISILLQRCFFENIGTEKDDVIKIHDLMHDIAQNVMGKELCTTKNISGSLDKNVRHLSLARTSFARYSFNATHIRSHFYAGYWCQDAEINQFSVEALVPNCLCLRALDLAWSKIKSVPDSIGGLLHLRYLDLSYNEDLEVLPNSIAKLYNLQTLQLKGCKRLEGLPKHLSRLVKLQTLDIYGCNNVTYMPKGMGKMTCLHTLSKFIVGGEGNCSSWKQWFDGLEDLKALNNLKGHLEIQIRWPENTTDAVKEDVKREGLYLNHKEHLNHIVVDFRCEEGGGRMDDEEARRLMEVLRPHPYLENLAVKAYYGAKMPVPSMPGKLGLSESPPAFAFGKIGVY